MRIIIYILGYLTNGLITALYTNEISTRRGEERSLADNVVIILLWPFACAIFMVGVIIGLRQYLKKEEEP